MKSEYYQHHYNYQHQHHGHHGYNNKLPVLGKWGPIHKSINGPHLYTVVFEPSGTLFVINDTLNGFSANISNASCFVNTNRWKLYLFLHTSNALFSTYKIIIM